MGSCISQWIESSISSCLKLLYKEVIEADDDDDDDIGSSKCKHFNIEKNIWNAQKSLN